MLPVVQSEVQGPVSEWNGHSVPPLDFFYVTYGRLANRPTDALSVFLAAHGRSAAMIFAAPKIHAEVGRGKGTIF